MESKRLPAQFGLTAKQATVPEFCVRWLGGTVGFTGIYVCVVLCMRLNVPRGTVCGCFCVSIWQNV